MGQKWGIYTKRLLILDGTVMMIVNNEERIRGISHVQTNVSNPDKQCLTMVQEFARYLVETCPCCYGMEKRTNIAFLSLFWAGERECDAFLSCSELTNIGRARIRFCPLTMLVLCGREQRPVIENGAVVN